MTSPPEAVEASPAASIEELDLVPRQALGGDLAPDHRRRADRWLVVLFTATAALGAGLLFVVEPLIAKLLLPEYGGSATVWSTSSLFFQTLLIGGYLYVHLSTSRLGHARQPWLHLIVLCLPLVVLPLTLPGDAVPPDGGNPALWLLRTLALMVGLPFAVLATTGPLLQKWFAWAGGPRSSDPYFLFAASNLGSFVGLLAYPFLIEPSLSLHAQRTFWSLGYLVFLGLTATCAVVAGRRRATPASAAESRGPRAGSVDARPVTRARALRWLGLAFVPSSLMLAVTAHISTDVAAIPLLWVVPLAIYLATFVAAFSRPRRSSSRYALRAAVAVGFAAAITAMVAVPTPVGVSIGLNLVLLALVSYAAHGRLAADRPDPVHLTGYFLVISIGGAIGGVLNGLVAPIVFDRVLEYPLVLLSVPLLLVGRAGRPRRPLAGRYHPSVVAPLVAIAMVLVTLGCLYVVKGAVTASSVRYAAALLAAAAVGWVLGRRPALLAVALAATFVLLTVDTGSNVIDQRRTFFGSYTVRTDGTMHSMIHGTTLHGTQFLSPERADRPTTYYSRSGPLGDVWSLAGERFESVGVVGLGAGTIAAYGRPGQEMTFYEIDPEMVAIAENPDLFTYLRDSEAHIDTVVGDGRLQLARRPSGTYDAIVLDAFSSDSIPVHLLTAEAMDMYADRLADGGVIIVHISNRLFDLRPVLAAAVTRLGWVGAVGTRQASEPGATASTWAVLTSDRHLVDALETTDGWQPLDTSHRVTWTDDYSSVLSVLR